MKSIAFSRQLAKVGALSLLVVAVLIFGTLGYHFMLGWNWLDSLYMTTITITTVGFGEVRQMDDAGRLLTIFLMLTSVGVFAYTLATLASLVVESHVSTLIWRRRMDKKIAALHQHYIICGYGRTGAAICTQLLRQGIPFVVLEASDEGTRRLREEPRILFVTGDATLDESLEIAGIKRAKGLVAALGNDAENVYLVLSARQLNPQLVIVSWAATEEAERKIARAGADHVFSPYTYGGMRISRLLTTPHALEFLDSAMGGSENMRIGEIPISETSPIAGKSLKSFGITREVGVIILGIRRSDGAMEFNPSWDTLLNSNDVLIGIGETSQIEAMRRRI